MKDFPYLIDDSLVDGNLENQFGITLSDGRHRIIDLIYFKKNEITIVELKKRNVNKIDVSQLSEYVDRFRELYPDKKIYGILAGQNIDGETKRSLEIRKFKFKKYFRDIPFKLKICSKCRKVIDEKSLNCKWCGNSKFMKL